MIEDRPLLKFMTHVTLALGVALVALPLNVAFVASTLTSEEVLRAPMTLVPGTHLLENYGRVLAHGTANASSAPVGRMMLNSLVTALVIAVGKITISILSAFALVYFQTTRRAPAIPVCLSVIVTVLGVLTALVLVYRVLINVPGPDELVAAKAGAYLALASTLGIVVGGYASMRREGILPEDGPGEIPTVALKSAAPTA